MRNTYKKLEVLHFPDPRLRKIAKEVDTFDESLDKLNKVEFQDNHDLLKKPQRQNKCNHVSQKFPDILFYHLSIRILNEKR